MLDSLDNILKCDILSEFQPLCMNVWVKLPYKQCCTDRSELQFISIFLWPDNKTIATQSGIC